MSDEPRQNKIDWYRSPVERSAMAALNRRSDLKGFLQTLGHLGILSVTGGAAWYATQNLPLPLALLIFFIHGTCYAFLLNAFHEFCHKTVFRTRQLNDFFLNLVSFLSWNNPVFFWASHQEHHKYTLHPPLDLEVVLPLRFTRKDFLKNAILDPWDFYGRLKSYLRLSLGKLEGEWEGHLFPAKMVRYRKDLFTWARLHLIGHALLAVVSLLLGWWQIPLLVTLAPFYGGWLLFLCNNTQHVGLMDNVPDFRLCARTFMLNPVVRFLYWHMNYHLEHHMYAAVPCYNLGKLHKRIEADLPPSPKGIIATWRQIIAIQKRQQVEPGYQFRAELPDPLPALPRRLKTNIRGMEE